MINFQPLNENTLVKLESAEEEKTASGIIIPDSAKTQEDQGEVVAVPPGAGEDIAVGDKVMFKRNQAIEINDGDDRYLVVPFPDIVGKYVEADTI